MRHRIAALTIVGLLGTFEITYAEDVPPAEIVVTDALAPELSMDKKPIAVLGGEKLHHHLESSLGDTVNILPGVTSSSFSPGAGRPVIRGKRGPRVAVLENSLHVGDVSETGDDHGVSYDPRIATRIEVLRGAQTLAYGSTAIGGVANIIDESIAEKKIGRKLGGEIDLAIGDSADNEKSESFAVKGDANVIQWFLAGYSHKTDDYKANNNLVVPNSDAESQGFKIGASHVWDKDFFGVSLKVHSSDYGVVGHEHEHEHVHEHEDELEDEHEHEHEDEHEHENEDGISQNEDDAPRIELNQARLDLRGKSETDGDVLKAVRYGASFSDYEHKEVEGNQVATKFTKNTGEGSLELRHELFSDMKGGFGFHLLAEDFKAEGEEAFLPPSERFSPAVFVVEDLALSNYLTVNAGGRYEFTSLDPETNASTKRFNSLSSSLGVVTKPLGNDDYSIALTGSYSERAPQATELFADGAHIAAQTFEIGNPSLSNEEAVGVELIGRKNTGRLTGSAGAFYEVFPTYLGLFGTGEEKEGFPVFEYKESEAKFWGFEGELDYKVIQEGGHNFSLLSGIDLVRAKDEDTNEWLPRTPPVRTRVGAEYRYDIFRLEVLSTFAEAQRKIAPYELSTDGFTKLDADASVKIPASEDLDLELYVKGTNLLDEEIRLHTSFTKDLAPARGRAFLIGIRGVF